MLKQAENLPCTDNNQIISIMERISYLKRRDGLTTSELSEKTGISIGTLNKIISGVTKHPTLETMEKIATVFNVPIRYFVDGYMAPSFEYEVSALAENGRLFTVTKEEFDIINKYREFSPDEKRTICNMIKVFSKMKEKEAVEKNLEKTVVLPCYISSAQGMGGALAETVILSRIRVFATERAKTADFACLFTGDALYPAYCSGTVLGFVKQDTKLDQIGMFKLNGEIYIRRIQKRRGVVKLFSINRDYPVITIGPGDDFCCIGTLVGSLEPVKKQKLALQDESGS